MPLSALPAVLIQSLMHSLQPKEILALARCCKWTLECADCAFAWRDCVPLRVRVRSEIVSPLVSPLLRWLPVSVYCSSRMFGADVNAILALCERLRVLELVEDCDDSLLSGDLLTELLSHPALQHLRLLAVEAHGLRSLFTLVAQLPMLCTLRLNVTRWISDPDPACLLLLQSAPSLTDLELPAIVWTRSCLPFLGQLSLRSLSLASPDFIDGGFRSFCVTPMRSRLRDLHIKQLYPGEFDFLEPEELTDGWKALAALQSLWVQAASANVWLPHAHHAPSLNRVVVISDGSSTLQPLIPTFKHLLVHKPKLELELRRTGWSDDAPLSLVEAFDSLSRNRITMKRYHGTSAASEVWR